jgi:hypothetical protein
MAFNDVLKKAFPFISAAAALGGPLGTMAAAVVGKAIGADKAPAATSDGIANAIATAIADPEQRTKLIQAEHDFQLQMAELGYKDAEELAATAAADRASARNREIQVRDWTPRVLAFIVVVLCFGGEGLYFRHGAPSNASPELIGRILGTLDSALILVLSYYFGSSAGSERKSELLANASTNNPGK